MIRAHMATYPPRRAVMLANVRRLARQVDALAVVLNQYDAIPAELSHIPNVEPVIPDRDLKDAGKFLPAAAPDDLVFLCDDDLLYPDDYVARTLERTAGYDLDRNVFGYQGVAFLPVPGERGLKTKSFLFRQAVEATEGIGIIGTGTALVKGRNLMPVAVAEGGAGFVDIRYSHWLFRHRILPWTLPRTFRWVRGNLPDHLRRDTLYHSVHRAMPDRYMPELRQFASAWPHMGRPYPYEWGDGA